MNKYKCVSNMYSARCDQYITVGSTMCQLTNELLMEGKSVTLGNEHW